MFKTMNLVHCPQDEEKRGHETCGRANLSLLVELVLRFPPAPAPHIPNILICISDTGGGGRGEAVYGFMDLLAVFE